VPELQEGVHTATVKVDGHTLFRVRGVPSFPADQRAASIAERIERAAADPSIKPDQLRTEPDASGIQVIAGDTVLVTITEPDARLEAISTQVLSQVVLKRVAALILSYREARRPEVIWANAGKALLYTLLLLAAVFLILRLYRVLERWAEGVSRQGVEKAKIEALGITEGDRIWLAVRNGLRLLRGVLLLIVLLTWLNLVLVLFPWTKGISTSAFELVLGPLRALGNSFVRSIPNLIFLGILFLLVRFLLKLTRAVFDAINRGTLTLSGFDPDWAAPTYRIVRIAIVAFGVIVAYPYLPGSGSEAFKGVSLFIGVLFSLGSSGAISNIVAGYSLTYRRAYRLGDRVKIGDTVGIVEAVRLQVTHLRSYKNEEIIIPNSVILNSHVINYSSMARDRGLILHTTVGIGYETAWRQVESMLLMAADRTPELLKTPPPFVLLTALGDFCVTYEINAFATDSHRMGLIYADLHRNILDVFNEYGVQIMTPAYEGDPHEPKIVPRSKWFDAPAGEVAGAASVDQRA
jgi:small-conductance mechanosensitive channel